MTAHCVACSLALVLVAGGAWAGDGSDDDEIEWSYARPEILKQGGPKLGRHAFQSVVRAAFPRMRRPDKHVEEGDPVIGRLLALRGRFLVENADGQVEPGPHAVALLAVWETDEGDAISWAPELVVVGLVRGRLVVMGREPMEDLVHDFSPVEDGGSAYRLDAWPLHPRAAGIGVRLDQIYTEPGSRSSSAQQAIVVIGLPEDGQTDGELMDVFLRSVEETSAEHVEGDPAIEEITRVQLAIDRQRSINGLYVIETEHHHSYSEGGRIRSVEIQYEWHCWLDGAYDTCDEGQLDPPAPLKRAR